MTTSDQQQTEVVAAIALNQYFKPPNTPCSIKNPNRQSPFLYYS
ncbi:MAG: hypothetical protein SWJ54_12505 [Cyanobacteriota bacterium]|nr:hypothetical protein [Cyanobacteriota bacterium]